MDEKSKLIKDYLKIMSEIENLERIDNEVCPVDEGKIRKLWGEALYISEILNAYGLIKVDVQ